MNRLDELEAVLTELREQHRRLEAPAQLGQSLRAAARSHKTRPMVPHWVWPMAAALVICAVLWRGGRPAQVVDRGQSPEQLTQFVALPGSETLPPPMQTSVLRMEMRKSDLRQFGFDIPPPLAAEVVQADFVVGDDGLARAVRFVR